MIKSDFPEKRRSTFPNPTVPTFCQAILAESNRVESSRVESSNSLSLCCVCRANGTSSRMLVLPPLIYRSFEARGLPVIPVISS